MDGGANERRARREEPGSGPAAAQRGSAAGAGDGLVGLYALRALDRGADLRSLVAEARAVRFGTGQRAGGVPRAGTAPMQAVGRGTAAHRAATSRRRRPAASEWDAERDTQLSGNRAAVPERRHRPSRRLAAVGLAALLALPFGASVARADGWEDRYVVQPGDTLASIAAGYGVDPSAIAAASGLDDPSSLSPDQTLVIPVTGPAPAWSGVGGGSAPVDTSSSSPNGGYGGRFVGNVPAYAQAFNLSCEYASAFIATSAFGRGVPESAFLANIPSSLNPHWGYRGNISGWWGNTDDYGVYPEALAPTLNAYGFNADVFYSGGDPSALTARIDAGEPVVVWLGYFGDTATTMSDDGTYRLASGTHVVVAYGYDGGGVYVSNPAHGMYEYLSWGDFLTMWSVLDGMALGVSPM